MCGNLTLSPLSSLRFSSSEREITMRSLVSCLLMLTAVSSRCASLCSRIIPLQQSILPCYSGSCKHLLSPAQAMPRNPCNILTHSLSALNKLHSDISGSVPPVVSLLPLTHHVMQGVNASSGLSRLLQDCGQSCGSNNGG